MIMVSHSLDNNTRTGYISLFKYKFFGQSVPPESSQILDIYSVVVQKEAFNSMKKWVVTW